MLAAQALRVGSLDYAAAICRGYSGPVEPAVQLTHAAALFGLGQHERALQLVDGVLALAPEHLAARFYRAQMAQHVGDHVRATELLLAVLERFPDFPGAQGALASLRLPGPPYRDVLRRLHELVRPRSYLELASRPGHLGFAKSAERAIGIDPDRSKLDVSWCPPASRVS